MDQYSPNNEDIGLVINSGEAIIERVVTIIGENISPPAIIVEGDMFAPRFAQRGTIGIIVDPSDDT